MEAPNSTMGIDKSARMPMTRHLSNQSWLRISRSLALAGVDSTNLADQYEQSLNLEGYDLVQGAQVFPSGFDGFERAFGFHREHQNPSSR